MIYALKIKKKRIKKIANNSKKESEIKWKTSTYKFFYFTL